MQAVDEASRLQKEAQSLKLRLNVAPLQAMLELDNEVKYLRQQLQTATKDNRALKGVSTQQRAGIQAIEAVEAGSQFEVLKQELASTRERFAQLKKSLAQESQTSTQEHKRYLDADRKLKPKPQEEEVKSSQDLTSKVEVLERAFKTIAKQSETEIVRAEARLKEVITTTNKNSVLLTQREQELKLRELKVRELQSKVNFLTQSYNATVKQEASKAQETEVTGKRPHQATHAPTKLARAPKDSHSERMPVKPAGRSHQPTDIRQKAEAAAAKAAQETEAKTISARAAQGTAGKLEAERTALELETKHASDLVPDNFAMEEPVFSRKSSGSKIGSRSGSSRGSGGRRKSGSSSSEDK
jgi:hypothetical protein